MSSKVDKKTTISIDREKQIHSFEDRLKACTTGKMPADKTAKEFENLIKEIGEAGKW